MTTHPVAPEPIEQCPRCPDLELQRLHGAWAREYASPLAAHYAWVHPGRAVGR